MKKIAWDKLVAAIVLCEAAGGIGAIATIHSIPTWYAALTKPPLNPPNWIFSPVWTTLYLLMGISLYLLWKKGFKGAHRKKALWFFFLQLVINLLWSFVFFGGHAIGLGLFVIFVLWGMIAVTITAFYSIDVFASLLLIPYFLWVSFAAYLNYGLWVLNR